MSLEYEAVLKRPGLVPTTPAEVDVLLDSITASAVCRAVVFRLRPAAADPGDDLVLEAAVATGCRLVVTVNPRHMRDAAGQYGLELLAPGTAVSRLGVST